MRPVHVALAASFALACGRSGEPPAPACRNVTDCVAAGMTGAQCEDQRCAFVAEVTGRIHPLYGAPPPGELHVVAYDASVVGPLGPACGARPRGIPVTIEHPTWPQEFHVEGLPDVGEVMLYAYVDVGGDTESGARAEKGDVVGVARVDMPGGRTIVDMAIGYDVDLTFDCD
jgi:hypothetical protein